MSQETTRSGQSVTVAVARAQTQGTLAAQDAARELIDELGPRLVVAVGIAGAVPSPDVFLGDVVLANDIRDLTRTAQDPSGKTRITCEHPFDTRSKGLRRKRDTKRLPRVAGLCEVPKSTSCDRKSGMPGLMMRTGTTRSILP